MRPAAVARLLQGLRVFVLPMLLALPMTASAAGWWCDWFPWLPACGTEPASCGSKLTEVSEFGSNPGNLKMCRYLPPDLGTSRPLVVALQGGPFPPVSIGHGTSDTTVNPESHTELVDQWTDVLGIDQTPDTEVTVDGQTHRLYSGSNGRVLVETVLVDGTGHGTPINPGDSDSQCGKAAPFILSAGICSSFHILRFWGLDSE